MTETLHKTYCIAENVCRYFIQKAKICKMFIVNVGISQGIELHVKVNEKDLVQCGVILNEEEEVVVV